MSSSIQTLRGILIAGAALAGVIGLIAGQTSVAVFMAIGVTIHLAFSQYLKRRVAPRAAGVQPAPPVEPVA
jgi:hypothetical protein